MWSDFYFHLHIFFFLAIDPETRASQSRQLAIKGNEEANNGQYERAVKLFSEAIRLESNDHRFFGNRSYCYDQLGQYEKYLYIILCL